MNSHTLEWLKFKELTIPNVNKDMEQPKPSYITKYKMIQPPGEIFDSFFETATYPLI